LKCYEFLGNLNWKEITGAEKVEYLVLAEDAVNKKGDDLCF
jgi:hypothetical protein